MLPAAPVHILPAEQSMQQFLAASSSQRKQLRLTARDRLAAANAEDGEALVGFEAATGSPRREGGFGLVLPRVVRPRGDARRSPGELSHPRPPFYVLYDQKPALGTKLH